MQKVWRRQWSHLHFDLRKSLCHHLHFDLRKPLCVEKHWVSDSCIENTTSEAPLCFTDVIPRQWSHLHFDVRKSPCVEKHWVSDSWIENTTSEAPLCFTDDIPVYLKKTMARNNRSTFFARAPIQWWHVLAHRRRTWLSSWCLCEVDDHPIDLRHKETPGM